MMTSTQVFKIW